MESARTIRIMLGVNGKRDTLLDTPGVHAVDNPWDYKQHALLSVTPVRSRDVWDGEVAEWARNINWYSVVVSEKTYLNILLVTPSYIGACIEEKGLIPELPNRRTRPGFTGDDFMWDTDMFVDGSEEVNHPDWPLGFAMPGSGRCLLLPVDEALLRRLDLNLSDVPHIEVIRKIMDLHAE